MSSRHAYVPREAASAALETVGLPNTATRSCHVSCMFLNLGGGASEKIPATLALWHSYDMYAFVETWAHDGSCHELTYPGYTSHHCVRPVTVGPGRHSGGITVLLRKGSPECWASVRSSLFGMTMQPA
jgi:hypothetical protein